MNNDRNIVNISIDDFFDDESFDNKDSYYEKSIELDEKLIKDWISDYTLFSEKSRIYKRSFESYVNINNDGSLDIEGDLCLDLNELKSLPSFIKFNTVKGTLTCIHNDNIESLLGFPVYVEKDVIISDCKNIKSLIGCPKKIGGNFKLYRCDRIESLEGGPLEIGMNYECCINQSLKSLKGCPMKINKDFVCEYNESLTSLEGGPEKVYRDFSLFSCTSLSDFNGFPKYVKGSVNVKNCKVYISSIDIESICNVKGKIFT